MDLGMLFAKFDQRRRQHVMGDGHETRDDDLPAQLAVEVFQLPGLLKKLAQQSFGDGHELAASFGLRHASCPAREQLHGEQAFRLLDDPAQPGLRHSQV